MTRPDCVDQILSLHMIVEEEGKGGWARRRGREEGKKEDEQRGKGERRGKGNGQREGEEEGRGERRGREDGRV